MISPVDVMLSSFDLDWCDDLAHKRQAVKSKYRVATKKFDGQQSDDHLHLQAVRAELAVARVVGGEIDTDITAHGRRGGNVLDLERDTKIMVRYRDKRHGDFALSTDSPKGFHAPVGALVWPGRLPGVFSVVGFITRAEFTRLWRDGVWLDGASRAYVKYDRLTSCDDYVGVQFPRHHLTPPRPPRAEPEGPVQFTLF